jgi:hypothetical protein
VRVGSALNGFAALSLCTSKDFCRHYHDLARTYPQRAAIELEKCSPSLLWLEMANSKRFSIVENTGSSSYAHWTPRYDCFARLVFHSQQRTIGRAQFAAQLEQPTKGLQAGRSYASSHLPLTFLRLIIIDLWYIASRSAYGYDLPLLVAMYLKRRLPAPLIGY